MTIVTCIRDIRFSVGAADLGHIIQILVLRLSAFKVGGPVAMVQPNVQFKKYPMVGLYGSRPRVRLAGLVKMFLSRLDESKKQDPPVQPAFGYLAIRTVVSRLALQCARHTSATKATAFMVAGRRHQSFLSTEERSITRCGMFTRGVPLTDGC
jgi:hypothetical protein